MSNTDYLRQTEASLLPEGFEQGHVFEFTVQDYKGRAEVDGWNPQTQEAIEICQSEVSGGTPKPGQKRKLASDVLKLIFLIQLGKIQKGKVYITCQELYTWLHQSGSWLSAATRYYNINVEIKRHSRKRMRKRIRNVILKARREG
ncbi:MAG: hypothetical protein ACOYUZ_05455 [Patescibacteria group bacterium]